MGLIASKIVDKTKRTTFVWGMGEEENILKGSVRSGEDGANVVNLMSAMSDVLDMFGGHEMAGGFAVHKDKIDIFHEKLKEEYKRQKKDFIKKENNKKGEIKLKARDVNKDLYKDLQKLSPFGMNNENPIFEIEGDIKGRRIFGDKGQHIEINCDGLSCVKFNVDKKEIQDILEKKNIIGNIE